MKKEKSRAGELPSKPPAQSSPGERDIFLRHALARIVELEFIYHRGQVVAAFLKIEGVPEERIPEDTIAAATEAAWWAYFQEKKPKWLEV